MTTFASAGVDSEHLPKGFLQCADVRENSLLKIFTIWATTAQKDKDKKAGDMQKDKQTKDKQNCIALSGDLLIWEIIKAEKNAWLDDTCVSAPSVSLLANNRTIWWKGQCEVHTVHGWFFVFVVSWYCFLQSRRRNIWVVNQCPCLSFCVSPPILSLSFCIVAASESLTCPSFHLTFLFISSKLWLKASCFWSWVFTGPLLQSSGGTSKV